MGPGHNRGTREHCLQRIVATMAHQTAADKGHVGGGIEKRQFTHRVAEKYLRGGAAWHAFGARYQPYSIEICLGRL